MHHTVVALAEDKPGVLERIASQFRRRAFNIVSVSAGRMAPGVTCITVVVDSDKRTVDRVIASISKLVNVFQVEDLGDRTAVARDLALVKVASSNGNRAAVQRIIDEGRGRLIDAGERTMSIEITGAPEQLDALIRELEGLGIIEMVRTGGIALARGDETINRQ
jgi:acetolactate synthase I/III small subunit